MLVAVLMGSKSDWETMRHASETLDKFGIAHECRVLSAHRTPAATAEYVSKAEERGFEVIIAAAGGAAHLARQDLVIGPAHRKHCCQMPQFLTLPRAECLCAV